MTLRLGFIGVGKWARKLAESFRACGAEIVAFDRRAPEQIPHPAVTAGKMVPGVTYLNQVLPLDGFGKYMPWREQLADKSIDAIVAVAPPEITTEIVMAAASAGKAVMGTKPLWDHPRDLTAPVYIDLWRLYSKTHRTAREKLAADMHAPLCINLYGNGPFRSFPGAFDWGPHVIAAIADLLPNYRISGAYKINRGDGETFRVHIHGRPGSTTLYFGNAQEGPTDRSYRVGDWCESEDGARIGTEDKATAMQRFAQHFLNDVSEGFVDTKLLNYSREGMALLRRIREEAK